MCFGVTLDKLVSNLTILANGSRELMSMIDTAENLRAQIRAREVEVEALKKALQAIEQSGALVVGTGTVSPLSNEYANLGTTEAAKRFLQELGRPATSRELWDGLSARGLRSGSRNPINSLGAALRQARTTFKHMEDGTWTLAKHGSSPRT